MQLRLLCQDTRIGALCRPLVALVSNAAANVKLHAWWAAAQCCTASAPCAMAPVLLQAQVTLLLRQLSSLGEGWRLEQLPGTPLHPPQEPGLCVGPLQGCSPPLHLSVKLEPGGGHVLFYHAMPDAEPQQRALGGLAFGAD